MRLIREHVVLLMTLTFVALALAQPGAASGVAAGVAILAVVMLLGARYAATVIGRVVTVGNRARAHRESLVGMPAPQHPATPGRTRSRAPAGVTAAA